MPFDEPTPAPLLEVIRPDRYVKGGDYTEETLPEADVLRRLGTDVQFLSLVEDRSTTGIIARIRDRASAG